MFGNFWKIIYFDYSLKFIDIILIIHSSFKKPDVLISFFFIEFDLMSLFY